MILSEHFTLAELCKTQVRLPNEPSVEVIERLKKFQALGYDEFSIWVDSHMSFEQKSKSLKLFIDKVLPAFK